MDLDFGILMSKSSETNGIIVQVRQFIVEIFGSTCLGRLRLSRIGSSRLVSSGEDMQAFSD